MRKLMHTMWSEQLEYKQSNLGIYDILILFYRNIAFSLVMCHISQMNP